ncbi:hypothetical protein FACS189490_04100 [Clostridia bacterium]|nr:hypothetical protein FACS189490_04100 [Clostridia bacterium]
MTARSSFSLIFRHCPLVTFVKSKKHNELRDKYQALKKRRGGKKAVIAIARKLLTAIWHILSKGEFYNAELYHKTDKPLVTREITPEQAFALLRSKGYIIKDISLEPILLPA